MEGGSGRGGGGGGRANPPLPRSKENILYRLERKSSLMNVNFNASKINVSFLFPFSYFLICARRLAFLRELKN